MADKNDRWEIVNVLLGQMNPGSKIRQVPHEPEPPWPRDSLNVSHTTR